MLAKDIISCFPKHTAYVEVFGGSGAVLLQKLPSKVEVYNDLDSQLVNFFRVLRDSPDELIRRVKAMPWSREEYERCIKFDPVDDPVEAALRWFFVACSSFGGHFVRGKYAFAYARNDNIVEKRWGSKEPSLRIVSARLRNTIVENLSWDILVKKYDARETLFYMDPPYVRNKEICSRYGFYLKLADHVRLVNALLDLKGYAILSGYKNREYKRLEQNGWYRKDFEFFADATGSRSRRKVVESLWISPNCMTSSRFDPHKGIGKLWEKEG